LETVRQKKILYLMEYPIDLPGGGQMSTKTLCDGIVAYSGHDDTSFKFEEYDDTYEFVPVVVCPSLLTKKPEDYSFKIVTYKSDENREQSKISRISNFLSRIGHFKKIISQEKPDIIHISMSESLISFGFLRCLGIFSKIPFVYTDRGLCYGYRKHSKLCIKATVNKAKFMLTTTQYNKDLWEKENLKCPLRVIPNTISSAFDSFNPDGRSQARNRFSLDENDFVVGFAGRISEEKDWPSVKGLVEAAKNAGIEFKVALVLSAYEDRDRQIIEDIKNGITDVIGSDRLIYMQDLSQQEISDYYYMVDVFVMTSSFESFGKAAVEAMSRKCAVLSTSVGGLPEVIGRKTDLYDKEDLKTFVERLKQLSQNKDLIEEEREYFYNRYKQLYTKEVNIVRHLDLYREIIN